jgi:hypothetical protein
LSRKNILPEDGQIVAAETCQRVCKCNCAVVGFINKFASLYSVYIEFNSSNTEV